MIETTSVDGAIMGAAAGTTSAATCGLTAMTMAAALGSPRMAGLSRRPRSASAVICGDGCGSITATFAGPSPKRSQPSSRALPILPAPTSTSKPGKSCKSGRRPAEGFEALIGVFSRHSGLPRSGERQIHNRSLGDCRGRQPPRSPIGHPFRASRLARPGRTTRYASPEVSNMTESIASRADLPAQTTNWNAGK